MLPFLLAVAGSVLGLFGVILLARGRSLLPVAHRSSGRFGPAAMRRLGLAAGLGATAFAVTRWPAAAVAVFVVAGLWPKVFGGAAAGRRSLRKVEAIALWTESLRDTAAAAAGLEQAIPATVAGASETLRRPLRNLSARLDGRVPLPESLALFADEVADPAADMVVAALSLNARQRAGGLARILTSLAESMRSELEMRRKVEHERNALRRQAQRIAGAVIGFVILQAMFARGWVAPYSTLTGQLVLILLMGVFAAAFVRMRSLAEPDVPARFLTSADEVTEIASYKPPSMARGVRW